MKSNSGHTKFEVIAFSTFKDIASQSYHSLEEIKSSLFDIYPLELTKLRNKSLYVLKTSFLALNYTPYAFPWFSSKIKN